MIASAWIKACRLLLLTATLLALVACASSREAREPPDERVQVSSRSDPTGQKAAVIALEQVGVPYRYGGNTPSGFDCSGLIHYAYGEVGKQVPRTTGRLWDSVDTIDRDKLRAGDILFFRIDGKMSHVGMYVGGGRFVHAPSSGNFVSVEALSSEYYAKAFLRAGRLR
jgi:cell wall-associated NlpC family hydrolase